MDKDDALAAAAREFGFPLGDELRIGGHYLPLLRDGPQVHISGQIPRVGERIVCVGAAGAEVSLDQARSAAAICALRALSLLQREVGLNAVQQLQRLTVYVRSASDFTQHSEVADAASDLLLRVLGDAGRHTRTSVGVLQLPKGATVELDLSARCLAPDLGER
ncbi:MAG TPA: RidA family protein [Burkholderiaceae bacterium]|nr:RidA family protein [Burkholderiaceae bacterium]HMY99766.1 RidA family protein [Burkholderiaceae bacterium]HNB46690.1 RidA family protein [Burkholderiaceae bacterium]HNG78449.1 RidA family protein [Burkholderiaceae bacterium]